MDDEELKRYAKLGQACEANGLGWLNEAGEMRFQPPADVIVEQTQAAAADRERELVEALRPFAGVVALLGDGLTYSICTEDGAVIVEDDDFRNAARVLQAKGDPTP